MYVLPKYIFVEEDDLYRTDVPGLLNPDRVALKEYILSCVPAEDRRDYVKSLLHKTSVEGLRTEKAVKKEIKALTRTRSDAWESTSLTLK